MPQSFPGHGREHRLGRLAPRDQRGHATQRYLCVGELAQASSAWALAMAIPASSMKSAMRDSVPAWKSSREVAATVTPQ